ncbi:MAG: GH39 family glycosyl hydrolase [Steroidobacteraceae bacterium]
MPGLGATGAGLAVCIGKGALPAYADDAGLRKVTVDATVTEGALRPFSGIHGAPAAEFTGRGPRNAEPTKVDISADYRAARIDLIRTHDEFGPGDIDAQFGGAANLPVAIPASRNELTIFPDMTADPANSASYHFEATDRMIASIKSVGAEPLFRVGRSIGAAADPPADLDKYAEIVRHVVLHYNKGWDQGFRYAIRYWEIWNEPDFRVFWTGPPQLYYTLYDKSARAIKAADAHALVGGHTISKALDAGAYREGFLEYVKSNRLPLDFFSWHLYTLDSNDPYNFVTIARELRPILDAHGFGATKIFLDEWNVDLFDRDMSTAARAAFAVSSLIYMLSGPIDKQAYYRGDTSFRHPDAEPDAVGHALIAFGSLKSTPALLQTSGGDDAGFAVIAGRSPDKRMLQILISNYQIAPKFLGPRPNGDVMHIPNVMDIQLLPRRTYTYRDNGGYDLTVKLPGPGKREVKRYRITDSANFALVDQSIQSGPAIHLQAALPPPGIEFIVITEMN